MKFWSSQGQKGAASRAGPPATASPLTSSTTADCDTAACSPARHQIYDHSAATVTSHNLPALLAPPHPLKPTKKNSIKRLENEDSGFMDTTCLSSASSAGDIARPWLMTATDGDTRPGDAPAPVEQSPRLSRSPVCLENLSTLIDSPPTPVTPATTAAPPPPPPKKKWWNILMPSSVGHGSSSQVSKHPLSTSSGKLGSASARRRLANVREEEAAAARDELLYKMASIDDGDSALSPAPSVESSSAKSSARSPDTLKKVTGFMKHLHVGPTRSKKPEVAVPVLSPVNSVAVPPPATPSVAGTEILTPCRNPLVTRREATKSEEESKLFRRQEVLKVMRRIYATPPEFSANYELLDLLGDGAFGFVFVARIRNPGAGPKRAAVKFIIRDKVSLDGWAHDSVYGYIPFEAHFIKQLSHPNIIRFLDLFQDDRFFYLVTEFHGVEWTPSNPLLSVEQNPGLRVAEKIVPPKPLMLLDHSQFTDDQLLQKKRTACDLFECIDAHRRIPEETAKSILLQIVDALLYLLSVGFVHRDLKDENVVIDQFYKVKLIDFGSASRIPKKGDTANYFDRFNGTLHFAAPEILHGQFYRGPEADVWALGVLLYTILFGENPFPNPDEIINRNIRFPAEPAGAIDLMQTMLEVQPEKRATLEQVRAHSWLDSVRTN